MFVKFTCRPPSPRSLGLLCSAVLSWVTMVTPVWAQDERTEIPAKTEGSAYLQDSRGMVMQSGAGLCWRNGYWTEEDAVAGCDGPLAPPIGKMIAPPLDTGPVAAQTSEAESATIPTRPAKASCEFTLTLEGDQSFAFNSAELSAAARRRLEQEVLPRISQCQSPPHIVVTGHTDRLGSASYNQQLSLRRAQAVANYLEQADIAPTLEVVGAGATQARQACTTESQRQHLIACLAPDRRVVIRVNGTLK